MESWAAQLGGTGSLAVAAALALLLGLRHATDPDHLTAVATIVLSERETGARRAGGLGLAWGFGHATTLLLLGIPVVLAGRMLPDPVHRVAELAVGLIIVALALRLLRRWRRGHFHAHVHEHDGRVHAHPHFHELASADDHDPGAHGHRHAEALGRSPGTAFGVGLVHGVGGSAGAGILLLAAISDRVTAMTALLVYAGGTALAMALVSAGVGRLLVRGGRAPERLERVVPAFGVGSLAVGVWYALVALGLWPFGR